MEEEVYDSEEDGEIYFPYLRNDLNAFKFVEMQRAQVYHANMWTFKPYHKKPELLKYIMKEDVHDSKGDKEIDFPYLGNDPNVF